MKGRFNSYDVACITTELQKLVGLRVNQIYDIDNKTYLIKLQDKDVKQTLLFESGIRFHTTAFEWPKNPSPSGFTMKLRKHLKNKRLESLRQLGTDRIIDFQFGIGDATYHLILELYDRGNLILCDHEMTILNVLRPHTEGEEVRFVVREKYPEARARVNANRASDEIVREVLSNVKADDSLKRILTPILDCGPTVLTHVLLKYDLENCKVKKQGGDEVTVEETPIENQKGKTKKGKQQKAKDANNSAARLFDETKDFDTLVKALNEANDIMKNVDRNDNEPHGFIIQKTEMKPSSTEGAEPEEFHYNVEYHPFLFEQNRNSKYKEFATFDAAVDEFYSTMVGQKIDMKTYQQECEALKKLSNVRKDHEKRLEDLNKAQLLNKQRAELITRNTELINSVLVTMRSAIANQMSWEDIKELVKNAQSAGDIVANSIKQLKLETNHVTLYLTDPYATLDQSQSEIEKFENDDLPSMLVDIDLGLSAYANATRYYDQKRKENLKENRTIESSAKALKNAERKTQEHLKEVRTISNISKARKVFWFEKFYWFISTENYLVIGGRDQQQNELIVKRYLRPNDIYVHADIQGASSVVIRNPFTGNSSDPQATIPPKTLLEAGAMAISYSVAWDAKVTTSAYWVRAEQVSKTAPTGEYLETGSFMIRGKKNFLPPCHLILGLSIMFKLEESSIARHAGERCVRTFDTDAQKKYELDAENVQSEENKEINQSQSDEEDKSANGESDSSDSDDEPNRFPDTHIKIGGLSTQVSQISIESSKTVEIAAGNDDEEEGAIIQAAPQQLPRKNRVIQKAKGKHADSKKKKQSQKQEITDDRAENQNEKSKSGNALKRGQKSKLKKIKEKYKDQDEEEKQMRMEILKSAGNKKPSESKEKENEKVDSEIPKRNPSYQSGKKPQSDEKTTEAAAAAAAGDVEAVDEDENTGGNDTDLLNSLTGCPAEEDELLFALPVVAPYNALHNYKYKVKITPGTGRRGKTSKTAFAMFLKEKLCSNQEKDLIKSIKPDAAARNMPGKVKLSAPQMQRLRN